MSFLAFTLLIFSLILLVGEQVGLGSWLGLHPSINLHRKDVGHKKLLVQPEFDT